MKDLEKDQKTVTKGQFSSETIVLEPTKTCAILYYIHILHYFHLVIFVKYVLRNTVMKKIHHRRLAGS